MKLTEFQAKLLFAAQGVRVPQGETARDVDRGMAAVERLGLPVVIKAQVTAGGRGKAGGVAVAHGEDEAREALERILGMRMVTRQSGGRAMKVEQVLVEQAVDIAREFYLALLPDRDRGDIVLAASAEGGMDIEETARQRPGAVERIHIDPLLGLQPFHGRLAAVALGLEGRQAKALGDLAGRLYQVLCERDALLLEVNPLALCKDGSLVAVDAKLELDDNALYRQRDVLSVSSPEMEDPLEERARQAGLNYVRLEGSVGTLVNGAGLAMAVMDLIKQAGGEPANFLDVGGGASQESIEQAFGILCDDPRVRVILVNIFGGILRCDVLARALVQAARGLDIRLPLVVRLEGTNVEEGRRILGDADLSLTLARDLGEAARLAVAAARAD